VLLFKYRVLNTLKTILKKGGFFTEMEKTKITFVDSIMGSGKSTIMFKKLNGKNNFIYCTPFLEETKRAVESCPDSNVQIPTEHFNSKTSALNSLITQKENIAISHELLKNIRPNKNLKDYTLILDEVVGTMSVYNQNGF
jgi:hypothetical protein